MLLISQIFFGGLFVAEEKILGDYYLDPLKVVGLEGMWGLCYYAVLLPILQFIPCHNDKNLCPNMDVMEDTGLAVKQWGMNAFILGMNFGIICSIAAFNASGVAVTKNASAAQRSTIDTCRTVLIWVFFLIYPNEELKEHFSVLQLIGFIILVFGTLVYNEILVLPFWGLNKNTKEERAKRATGDIDPKRSMRGNMEKDADFVAMSPTTSKFDAQRGKRNIMHKQENQLTDAESSDFLLDNQKVNS